MGMEKIERMGKRKNNRMKNKKSTQTVMSEKESGGVSIDNKDTSQTEKTWNLGDLEGTEKISSSKPRRSSLLDEFECIWIPDEKNDASDTTEKLFIDFSSDERNKTEPNCVPSRHTCSKTSIVYDLPVFPLSDDSKSIPTHGGEEIQVPFMPDRNISKSCKPQKEPKCFNGSLECSCDCGFTANTSKITLDSSRNPVELIYHTFRKPAIEFLQDPVILNNFIPPPRVINAGENSVGGEEIPAPFMADRNISKSCKPQKDPKCSNGKTLRDSASEATLCAGNNENSSREAFSPIFNTHLKGMFPENHFIGNLGNAMMANFSGNFPCAVIYHVFKPHPVGFGICEDPYQLPYGGHPNFNFMNATSCAYKNPFGVPEHFPEFKSVM